MIVVGAIVCDAGTLTHCKKVVVFLNGLFSEFLHGKCVKLLYIIKYLDCSEILWEKNPDTRY